MTTANAEYVFILRDWMAWLNIIALYSLRLHDSTNCGGLYSEKSHDNSKCEGIYLERLLDPVVDIEVFTFRGRMIRK